jgi:hypothetical protein
MVESVAAGEGTDARTRGQKMEGKKMLGQKDFLGYGQSEPLMSAHKTLIERNAKTVPNTFVCSEKCRSKMCMHIE